ncbi:hypothetical protein JCM11491_007062 [Sporobolomyces phaffii]
MHFSLATILAASTLLFPPSLAAPLPNYGDSNAASGSCATDSGSVINVGVGVGVGNSIYRPSNSVKVKQGDQGSCPSGWTRSLLEVDLCIQVGGNDHQTEKQQWRPDPTHRALHTASPYWGAKTTSATTNPHRASHTSAPQKDEWTPRGGNHHKDASSASSSPTEKAHSTPRHSSSSSSSSTNGARPTALASSRCPRGQTLGTGSLIDVCVDVDTDPLFVGGGIKIGGTPPSPSSSTAKGRSPSQTTSSSASPAATASNLCSDDARYDSFLGVCIDIDTDPLFVGGGIKIGGSPQSQPQRPSSSAPSRNVSPTPRPSSSRPGSQQNENRGDSDQNGDLPECDGPSDPRAYLDLCVNAGNLLGARIKLGGSGSAPSRSEPASSSSSSRSPQSTPFNPNKGKNGQQNKNDGNVQDGQSKADGSLPRCKEADDPDALLGLCVQVGDILGAGVKIGGSDEPSPSRSPNNAKSSAPSDSAGKDGDILDLSLGNLLNAKIGSGSGTDSTPSSSTNTPTSTPRKVKQTAPIVTYPNVEHEHESSKPKPKNNNSSQNNRDDDDNDEPAISVNVSAQVQVGPSATAKQARPTTTQTPPAAATRKACPVGQILHLGICVEADVDVPGVVHATAAATVAV